MGTLVGSPTFVWGRSGDQAKNSNLASAQTEAQETCPRKAVIALKGGTTNGFWKLKFFTETILRNLPECPIFKYVFIFFLRRGGRRK